MEKRAYAAFGFDSTYDAMESERLCKEAQIACRLIPRPLELGGAACGFALRAFPQEKQAIADLLSLHGIVPFGSCELLDY